MSSLPEQYDPVVDNLEIRLMKKDNDPDKLMLDDLQEKLSDRYACIIDKEEHKSEIDKELNGNFHQQLSTATKQWYVNHAYKMKQKVLCKDTKKLKYCKTSDRKRKP